MRGLAVKPSVHRFWLQECAAGDFVSNNLIRLHYRSHQLAVSRGAPDLRNPYPLLTEAINIIMPSSIRGFVVGHDHGLS